MVENENGDRFILRSLGRLIIQNPLYWLLAAIPAAVALRLVHADARWVFAASCLAIIPLAGLMGRATEGLAARMGASVGGLLNATFGNAAELIIALVALRQGPAMYPVVKASLTGSIIGNILLVLGASLLAGGLLHTRQVFNRTAASMGATLLALATAGLLVPTLYYYAFAGSALLESGREISADDRHTVEFLSEEIAVVLAVVYGLSLVFSLHTHRGLFDTEETDDDSRAELRRAHHEEPEWSRRVCMAVLFLATAGVALMSELLIHAIGEAAHSLGMNSIFVGVVVVAVIGNAAEHSTAILMAVRNRMNLAVNIAIGSSIQIALFVAPTLVFASMLMGHERPLDLHFSPMEIVAVIISILVLSMVSQDGESHWFEGAMLLAVYVILALAFFHLPEPPAAGPPTSTAHATSAIHPSGGRHPAG